MPKKPMVNLTRLTKLMEKKGYGIGELAEYSGVKYDTVYSLVKGRRTNTTADTLKRIADCLDTSIDYLLGETDDDKPPLQKLPENIRQLADTASQLSEARRDELLRIATTLLALEREASEQPISVESMRALLEMAEEVKRSGVSPEMSATLDAFLRGNSPRSPDDPLPGQGFDKPVQDK